MASYLVFSVQWFLLISVTSASHFYGGTMRFVPKGRNPEGSLQPWVVVVNSSSNHPHNHKFIRYHNHPYHPWVVVVNSSSTQLNYPYQPWVVVFIRYHNHPYHPLVVVVNSSSTQLNYPYQPWVVVEDEHNLIFKNELTTFGDVRDIITRQHLLEFGFFCQYPKRGNPWVVVVNSSSNHPHNHKFIRSNHPHNHKFIRYHNHPYHPLVVVVNSSSINHLPHNSVSNHPHNHKFIRYHNHPYHPLVVVVNSSSTQLNYPYQPWVVVEDEHNLIFKNELTTFGDVRDIITRQHLLEFGFFCQYPKRGNVTLGFTVHRDNFTLTERGFGEFTYNFEFYPDNLFGTMVNPSLYPLVYDIGDKIYMQIKAISSVNNTELFVESCRASPYDNPNYQSTYSIIENGCTVDPTVVIYSQSPNKQFQFSIDAFKFIGLHDQVYISCSVLLCEIGNPNTRCSKGCVTSNQQLGRIKRAAVIETGVHFISQGPLRLRSTPESDKRVTGLNLNLAFIAGCLLAAVAMICGVVMIHKFKRIAVQYQPLPTTEQ
ncbi:hypothetical protein NHX12_005510 [Muraenolepis orangiensis]|uniref:ZP domain-containing protein n=1 Tax=Muraenolepis orangiensis TaxID=630683 RepID=A0A9Q0DRH0_9TELE|nr:hypothetical protein NHX12_005510 [Muraenolepis orangiensis]